MPKTLLATAASLVAFAANSLLARAALGVVVFLGERLTLRLATAGVVVLGGVATATFAGDRGRRS